MEHPQLLDAFAMVVAERGYRNTDMSAVARVAGVPETTLVGLFGDKASFLLAAYDKAEGEVASLLAGAAGYSRMERFERGLMSFLCFCSERPEVARMAMVELDALGPRGFARYVETTERLGGLVARALGEGAAPSAPLVTGYMVVGSIRHVVARRVAEGRTAQLPELAPGLMSALVPLIGGPA